MAAISAERDLTMLINQDCSSILLFVNRSTANSTKNVAHKPENQIIPTPIS